MRTEREAPQLARATKGRRREKTSVETCGTKTCFSFLFSFCSLSLSLFALLLFPPSLGNNSQGQGVPRLPRGRTNNYRKKFLCLPSPPALVADRAGIKYKPSLCSLLNPDGIIGSWGRLSPSRRHAGQ